MAGDGEHRVLRFTTLDDVERELARIEEAERAGRLKTTGNWTAGQILNHLGAWIEFGYEGYPNELAPPPLPIRVLLRLTKGRFLRRPLPRGFRIPKVEGGTLATDEVSFDQGMSLLRQNLARLERGEAPRHPSPAFGELTHEQAVLAVLRHAELHLGYMAF